MTSKLLVKQKDIVVPGEKLAQGLDFLPGERTYREGDYIVSSRLGLVSVEGRAVKIIKLGGKYIPKVGDRIIVKVFDITFSGWRVETNSAYSAMLSIAEAGDQFIPRNSDLTRFFNIGDYILTKIKNITSQNLIDISMKDRGLRKLGEGRILSITPCKVPRVIGKNASMISMIKDATGCRITVGQNGLIWLNGEDPKMEFIASKTIKKIEAESHFSGLTDRIKEFLEKETGKKVVINTNPKPREDSRPKFEHRPQNKTFNRRR
tara:strand:+ start:12213 stop:13001 length:789 start_codon:yes stop_codon:yes gene_type:complete